MRADRSRTSGRPEYFTVENRLTYVSRGVFSVLRRTPAGVEEVHTGPRGWVRSELLGQLERGERVVYRHLPVPAQEAEAIIATRPATPRVVARRALVHRALHQPDGRVRPRQRRRAAPDREGARPRAELRARCGWSYGGWEIEDSQRGKSDDEYLPISPDEAAGVMARLDG